MLLGSIPKRRDRVQLAARTNAFLYAAVNDQVRGLLATAHHSLEQFNEQLGVERACVDIEPKGTPRVHR